MTWKFLVHGHKFINLLSQQFNPPFSQPKFIAFNENSNLSNSNFINMKMKTQREYFFSHNVVRLFSNTFFSFTRCAAAVEKKIRKSHVSNLFCSPSTSNVKTENMWLKRMKKKAGRERTWIEREALLCVIFLGRQFQTLDNYASLYNVSWKSLISLFATHEPSLEGNEFHIYSQVEFLSATKLLRLTIVFTSSLPFVLRNDM